MRLWQKRLVVRTARLGIVGILGIVAVVAGCGGSSSKSVSSSKNTFVLSEFKVTPPTNTMRPGRVTLTANNVGGEVHELVIARAASASALPTKSDGSVDEDKIRAADKIGEIADVAAHSQASKLFNLEAGTYVAFCNIIDSMMGSNSMMHGADMGSGSGHVHFSEGMHVVFTVK